MVNTGTAVDEPYEAAVTPDVAKAIVVAAEPL